MTRAEALTLYEHFVWSFDGQRAFLNASSWTVNHGDASEANIEWHDEGDRFVGTALVDLEENTELLMDYGLFKMPPSYTSFCAEHGFEDVKTATLFAATLAK